MTAPVHRQLEDALRAARNADGGWGYAPSRASRLEPTCWALFAQPEAEPDVLIRWPLSGGLLVERAGGEPNGAFHAMALLALTSRGVEHEGGNTRLVRALQTLKGIPLAPSTINRQNNRLQGWSWIPDTFSWVEPTAWSLLALKRAMRLHPDPDAGLDRVREGEALLFDRCCTVGGWNYGNSNMLGQELKPYVPTTAVALLALQDRGDDPAVVRSAALLEERARSEPSAFALSLALLALRVYGLRGALVEEALLRQAPSTVALDNILGVAMALTALAGQGHAAFAL